LELANQQAEKGRYSAPDCKEILFLRYFSDRKLLLSLSLIRSPQICLEKDLDKRNLGLSLQPAFIKKRMFFANTAKKISQIFPLFRIKIW